MKKNKDLMPIAIIGIACRYPGATTPLELWENILSKRRQFRLMPDCRLPLKDYFHPDRSKPDKTYGNRAALIDGFEFDWAKHRIPRSTYQSTDIVHWLALETCIKAFEKAGYARKAIPGERTSVIVGNTLTGEQTRSGTMRLRWPFVKKALTHAAEQNRMHPKGIQALTRSMESGFKSVFPPVDEDTLAGGLSNTIAGRICNYLNLFGGGYSVDGACSSSLLATATACLQLSTQSVDLAVAGGVDISLDPFELVGFAKAGALTDGDMMVYDRRGKGFLPGEGCGFIVLKRLEDAKKDNNYIYAVINGWGISSDGGGAGITAPNSHGQSLALKRAWEKAGLNGKDLDFIEGHGTGTTVGDRAELESIALAMGKKPVFPDDMRTCGITSLKSIIGHTKAASGIGGLIKTVMAVNRRVIPPTAACTEPHPVFNSSARSVYPVLMGRKQDPGQTLNGGVSSMGFGGINCHIAISSCDGPEKDLTPEIDEEALMASGQESEVFVLSARSGKTLGRRAENLIQSAATASQAELTDLAFKFSTEADHNAPFRAAVIAGNPEALTKKLQQVSNLIDKGALADASDNTAIRITPDIWLGSGKKSPRVGFLYPGQGSQKLNMGLVLKRRFQWAKEMIQQGADIVKKDNGLNITDFIFKAQDRAPGPEMTQRWLEDLSETRTAQPAISLLSLLWTVFLEKSGITPYAAGGHSLGELAAFYAAGMFDKKTTLAFASSRGKLMGPGENENGAMAGFKCPKKKALGIIDQVEGYLVVANINAPDQTVISGDRSAVEEAVKLAKSGGIAAQVLPVSGAFHSRLTREASKQILMMDFLESSKAPEKCRLFTSTSGKEVTAPLALNRHFSHQAVSQVNFVQMVTRMADCCDLFIEVGPGRVLSGLASRIVGENGPPCLPLESDPFKCTDLNRAAGALFANGAKIKLDLLYENRLVRPFTPAKDKQFIQNPCEKKIQSSQDIKIAGSLEAGMDLSLLESVTQLDGTALARYLEKRGPFLSKVIQADMEHWPGEDAGFHAPSSEIKALQDSTPQTPAGKSAIITRLYKIVEDVTGFDRETLSPDARLLDDLNLDSIKAGDLITRFAQACGAQFPDDPSILANATLAELVDAVSQLTKTEPAEMEKTSRHAIENLLIKTAAGITGFPEKSITLEMKLLDDLNLDSIKAGDIISKIAIQTGVRTKIDFQPLVNARLSQIADLFENVINKAPGAVKTEKPVDHLETILKEASEITGFSVTSIDPDALIEPDLKIGPEKLKRLISGVSQTLRIEARMDMEPLKNRSLRQVADIFKRISGETGLTFPAAPHDPLITSEIPGAPWVRTYGMQLAEVPFPILPDSWKLRSENNWQIMKTLIVYGQGSKEIAQTLENNLLQRGAQSEMESFDPKGSKARLASPEYSHIFMVLPKTPEAGRPGARRLKSAVDLLSATAVIPPSAKAPRRRTTLVYVQFGGGYMGRHPLFASFESGCSTAMAASLHLERPDLRVRVVDLSPALRPEVMAWEIIAEAVTPNAFDAVGYDHSRTRRCLEPVLMSPSSYPDRPIKWTETDVILSTGGAKGITASCTLAVALKTGARAALVGRTPHPKDNPETPEGKKIQETLDQYREKGLVADYFSCDMTDRKSVRQMVQDVEKAMGPVTGVIHGAGLNIPRMARHVVGDQAFKEISPKVLGAAFLLDALEQNPPKLIIGMGSIIGISGMPGNAWYGFSNEALDMLLRKFSADHKQTKTLTIAYSIWKDKGMGARMGSVDRLRKQGIDAISTPMGVSGFVRLFTKDPNAQQVVVTSRLTGLDTWKQKPPQPVEGLRFLENLIHGTPGVESVFSSHLSLEKDLYLKDHNFQGSFLFPTVFGLEAMAQAVSHVTGITDFSRVRIKNIHLDRPITVDPKTGADILIFAVLNEREKESREIEIETGIIKRKSGYDNAFFSAVFVLEPDRADMPETSVPDIRQQDPLPLIPASDLYRQTLLFQGKGFQQIQKVYAIEKTRDTNREALFTTLASGEKEAVQKAFSTDLETRFLLGDPFVRDTLLQSSAILTPKDTSLPVYIRQLDIFPKNEATPKELIVKVNLVDKTPTDITNQVVAATLDGASAEILQGYGLKIIKHHNEYPSTLDLVDPTTRDHRIIEGAIKKACTALKLTPPQLFVDYIPGIHRLKKDQRRKAALPFLKGAAATAVKTILESDAPAAVAWDMDGKPLIQGSDLGISLSHDERLCVCAISEKQAGCDVAPVTPRTRPEWQALINEKRMPLLDRLMEQKEPLDTAGTRIWAAMEAAFKATGQPCETLSLKQQGLEGVLFTATGKKGSSILVLTVAVFPTWGPEKIIAAAVAPLQKAAPVETPLTSDYPGYEPLYDARPFEMLEGGPQGQLMFVQRLPVTFSPSAQLSRTIYFSNYIKWMGNTREASAWPVLAAMSRQFESGRWGGVTNWGHLKILGEGGTASQIEIRMWVSDNSGPENSTMTLTYDFRKMLENGGYERLALCRLQTTWVEIIGQGEARVAPYPDYYDKFIEDMCPQFDAPDIPEPMTEPLSGLFEDENEPPVYTAPTGPVIRPVLREQVFETTLAQANLVGNIYYANYYEWQGQIRDRFFYNLIPEYYVGTGEKGEVLCLESRVNHLREAMPFDRIILTLALKELKACTALFHVEYYRKELDGSRVKIAYGSHRSVWVRRDETGKPVAEPFPKKVRQAFETAISKIPS